ncbi:hypothetical protein ACEQ8H_006969 [Pleosporales sp. CAS-2024a]
MHLAERPPYHHVNFEALAELDANFKLVWEQSNGQLDFQDPASVKALSQAILQAHFALQLEVPSDRLCPPIPNRWNYVTWIHGLLDSTSPSYSYSYDANRPVIGLDIGTGASAIYTMLCLQSRPNWTMCATDIDKRSFESAARNLALNNLMTRTKLLQTTALTPLIPLAALGVQNLDFTMCNPPFFTSTADMTNSLKGEGKSWKPNATCTGAEVEMVCPEGDLGFVTRLVNESLMLGEKVQWYTTMFGKLSSAKAIISLLKQHGITNWAVGIIDTGSSTKRWLVAWSFGDLRPKNSIARLETISNDSLPFPTSYTIPLSPSTSSEAASHILDRHLSVLNLTWSWDDATCTGISEARQNVWSRAYRRAFEQKKKAGIDATDKGECSKWTIELAVRIRLIGPARVVELEWLRGRDQVLWESFCGAVHGWYKRDKINKGC